MTGEKKHVEDHEKCVKELTRAVEGQPGIIRAQVDKAKGAIQFDYDPKMLSSDDILKTVQKLGPKIGRLLHKCTFRLDGRACEACAQALETKLQKTRGIRRATASYIGGVMSIAYDEELTSPAQVLEKVRSLGARVKPIEEALAEEEAEAQLAEKKFFKKIQFWLSGNRLEVVLTTMAFVTLVMGLVFERYPFSNIFYFISYATGGWFGVRAGMQSLRHGKVDIDLLMVLAALGAAWVGEFWEGAMLLFLFSFSNVLQVFAIGKTRNAIKSLAKMRPQMAIVARGDWTKFVPIEEVALGEHILIRPGDLIPLDGAVVSGESSVNQSSVTGESMPVNKQIGDMVFAGTLNQHGSLTVAVSKLAHDSTITKLITMVEEAQSEKAKTQRFLDQAGQVYAVGVILFTLSLIFLLPWLAQQSFSQAFYTAITVMVVASPCALVISTPASILSAIGNGALRGILFKGGAHLERAAGVRIVAFDKTGTLTEGKPAVKHVVPLIGTEEELLALAASVESKSEHPLAQAIVEFAFSKNIKPEPIQIFQSFTGKGAWGIVQEKKIVVGSWKWMNEFKVADKKKIGEKIRQFEESGEAAVVVGVVESEKVQALGIITLADQIRPDAVETIQSLKRLGIQRIVMLTGDSERVARAVAKEAGIDEFYAELLPEDKVRLLKNLSQGEATAMIGDGTNDAPALAAASVGIAMGAAGSDVALESADVVLMANDLEKISHALALSREAKTVVIQNLVFAGLVILMMVISTLILPFLGTQMPLPLGVLAHEGGTVLVCLNGLRLLAFRLK
ncbi:MAG: heavy metal translocating P-type ATPase [Verrucomicrobiota bacterium]